jgi:hypothetical protein
MTSPPASPCCHLGRLAACPPVAEGACYRDVTAAFFARGTAAQAS